MTLVIGVDVGGTKIEAILFDGKKILKSERVPAMADKSYAVGLSQILTAINAVKVKGVKAVGLGIPGYTHKGKLAGAPHNPAFAGKFPAKDIAKRLKLPVVQENDAKCFAFAEAKLGAGKNKTYVVGVIIGTGVGSALIIDGEIYRGAIGAAGEIGHAPHEDADYEYCVSGPGIVRTYREWGGTAPFDAHTILTRGKTDAAIEKAREHFYDTLGRMTSILVDTLNPEVVVFGGGVSKSMDYKRLTERTKHYAYTEIVASVKLVKHKISDSSGSIGAALLALMQLSKR